MGIALLVLTMPLASRAAVAPPSGPSAELLQNETRRRVSEEVKKFLEERCPQQCDIGEVTVKVGPRKPPVGTTPGFEELQPDRGDYLVERVDVNLMLDKRLTNDFRSGVRTIIGKKLEAEGMQNVVHEALIHFPTPQELPDKPPPQAAQPPREDKPEPEKKLEPAAPIAPERSLWERFVDNLPLLLGLLLCAGVVWFTLRQYQRILEARTDAKKDELVAALSGPDGPEGKKDAAARAAAEAKRELERAVESMRGRLEKNRALTRAVVRDLLARGAPADSVLAVVMLGPWILDGVRGDVDSRGGLAALDDYLTERSPADTPEARKRVLADLDRRILRVQVQRGEHPEETPFAYLSEASTTLFVRLLAEEPLAVQATILPHAPGPLSQAFLEAQPPAVREQLVRPLLEHGPAEREELQAVAVAFRDKLARHQVLDHGDGHADPIADLLLAAPVEERRRLIASLRGDPIALRRALGSFVDEETLRALDGEVLATAMARVDPGTAALFVGSLDEVGRKRLLASLPPAAGRAIAEEAEVLTASPARRAAARRAVLQVVRHAVEERGLDLAEINRGLLFRKEVAS